MFRLGVWCTESALLHKSGPERSSPFPRTDLSYGHSDRNAARGVAVQYGATDLKLGDLTVEVARHQGLAELLEAVHLCLDTASAMVAAPSSPKGWAQVLRGAQGVIACDGTRARGLPGSGILAWCNDSSGVSSGDCSWHLRVS